MGSDGRHRKYCQYFAMMLDGQKPLIFTRGEKTKPVSKEELEKYTGTYMLGNMEAKVYVKEALHLLSAGASRGRARARRSA